MKTYIALMSGGRDSTAMVDFILKNKMPLDHIIFDDTLLEFEIMYEYIEKFNKYLKKTYGREIIILKPKTTFDYWVFGEVTRGERKGWIRGLPMLSQPCFWKRESKVKVTDAFVKDNKISEPIFYVGYTHNEQKRSKVKADNQIYPLIDNKICEADVDRMLEKIDMKNPLYDFFSRTGCAICPYQDDRAFFTLYNKFPKWWEKMKYYEHKLKNLEKSGKNVVNSQWDDRRTIDEMEQLFINNPKGLSVIPPKSCECKTVIPDINMRIAFDELE